MQTTTTWVQLGQVYLIFKWVNLIIIGMLFICYITLYRQINKGIKEVIQFFTPKITKKNRSIYVIGILLLIGSILFALHKSH
jgi:hypothetical protein